MSNLYLGWLIGRARVSLRSQPSRVGAAAIRDNWNQQFGLQEQFFSNFSFHLQGWLGNFQGGKGERPGWKHQEIGSHLECAKGWPKRGRKCNFLYLLTLLQSRFCRTWQQCIDFSGVSFYNYKRKRNYWLGRKTSLFCFVKEPRSFVCSEEIEMH